jgi:release factor glutamine methyltransferase
VLDLCTGSGVLALEAALAGARRVTAVDVSRRAIAAVRLNSRLNGIRIEALRGDLFAPVRGRRFDLIVSNPPYLPSEDGAIPRTGPSRAWEGGAAGRAFLDRISAGAGHHLNADGALLLVQSSVCGERTTLDRLRAHGLAPVVRARRQGPLGPLLRARAEWLGRRSLVIDGQEEILVIRAQRSGGRAPRSAQALDAQLGCGTIRM